MTEATTEAPAPINEAAALFPDGGGVTDPVAPNPDAGAESTSGEASTAGEASVVGTPEASGAETTPGSDSLTADSYTLTLPDTFTADDALLSSARDAFAAAGVAPDKAQSLIDVYVKAQTDAASAASAAFSTQQTEWMTTINSMPEFQGEARATSLQSIGKVFDTYGTPEARAALDAYGIGNNPALAKMFLSMANALNEGEMTSQGRPAPNGRDGRSLKGRTAGEVLFGGTPDENSIMTRNH